MNWSAIQSAVASAVTSASGLPDVVWMNAADAAGWRADNAVELVLRSPQGIGIDETRYVYDAPTDSLVPSQAGPRRFVVSVRISSLSQLPGAESVGALSSLLRTRLRRPSVLAALRAAGIAIAEIGPTTVADFESDDRMVSMGITDITLLAAENDEDTTDAGDWIKTVELQSDSLRDVDGTDLPDALQVDLTITRP